MHLNQGCNFVKTRVAILEAINVNVVRYPCTDFHFNEGKVNVLHYPFTSRADNFTCLYLNTSIQLTKTRFFYFLFLKAYSMKSISIIWSNIIIIVSWWVSFSIYCDKHHTDEFQIFTSICIDQSFTIINILVSWSVGWYCLFVCLMVLLDWAGLGAYQLLSSNLIVNAEGNLSNEIMVAVARFVMKSYKLKLSLKNTWRIII